MKKKTLLTFGLAVLLNAFIAPSSMAQNIEKNDLEKEGHRNYNFIKTNVTGILLKNYSLQYEKVLSRKISLALQLRAMPTTGIPLKKTVSELVGDEDPDIEKAIDDFRLSNFAITPEMRIYLSKKGYGQGFYIAPFYRYASFKSSNLKVFYTDDMNVEQFVSLSGTLSSHTGGILLGVQKTYGKQLVLDFWLLGPHLGSGEGLFDGVSSGQLSNTEQEDVRSGLEDLDIPFTDKTVNVNANGASLGLDGPWGGIRSGISLGIRF